MGWTKFIPDPAVPAPPYAVITAWNDHIDSKAKRLHHPEDPTVSNQNASRTSDPSVVTSLYTPKNLIQVAACPPRDKEHVRTLPAPTPVSHWKPHWWRIAQNSAFTVRDKAKEERDLRMRSAVRWVVWVLEIGIFVMVIVGLWMVLRAWLPSKPLHPPSVRDELGLPLLQVVLAPKDVFVNSTEDDPWLLKSSRALGTLVSLPVMRKDKKWRDFAYKQGQAISLAMNDTSNKVLFVGDDFFETWVGTAVGADCAYGLREICRRTHKYFEDSYDEKDSLMSAISGDTTENMLWRWSGVKETGLDTAHCGSAGASHLCKAPIVGVIHAGSVDMDEGRSPEVIAAAIRALLLALRNRLPGTHFVVLGLLPRADDVVALAMTKDGVVKSGGRRVLPDSYTSLSFRDSEFYYRTKRVNAWLRLIAMESRSWHDSGNGVMSPSVVYKDCSQTFLMGGTMIPLDLMPNGRHLSFEGHKWWMRCVHQVVGEVFKDASAIGGHKSRLTKARFATSNKFLGADAMDKHN